MAELKEILVRLPADLLREMEGLTVDEELDRSQLIRDAMRWYIGEKRKRELIESMKEGYQEMAELNLSLAEEGLASSERAEGNLFDELVSKNIYLEGE